MPHMSVLSSLIWRRRRCSQSSAQRHRTVPSKQRWNEHTGSAFVGRLPATFSSAHDDCVCRGSSAEYFDEPFLVTLSRERAWRYRYSGLLDSIVSCVTSTEPKALPRALM